MNENNIHKLYIKTIGTLSQKITINDFISYKQFASKKNLKNNYIFIAAMPKSAGTYISKMICKNLNYNYIHVGDRPGACEFDLYLPNLIDNFITKKNNLVHQHTPATKGNIEYFNQYNIKPVVIFRDIIEVTYSMHRHILKYQNTWPFFAYPKDFINWESKKQLDFIIDFIVPWIIYFQQTWLNAINNNKINALLINYEDFVKFPEGTLNNILEWTNHEKIDEWVSIEKQSSRFESNRSKVKLLTQDQKNKIQNILNYYR